MSTTRGNDAAVRVIGGWASPFVMRVCIALRLKGVEYEFLQEELGKKSDLLLASNPVYKKIPVLLHRGRPVCESMIILQYIDEVWASTVPAILPADPYARAVQRFWADFVDAELLPPILTLRGTVEGDKAEAAEQVDAALQHLEAAFVECSQGKRYFGGDDISYLDIVLGSRICWLKAVEKIAGIRFLHETKVPKLVEWAGWFWAHGAAKDVLPDTDRIVAFNGRILDMLKATASQ